MTLLKTWRYGTIPVELYPAIEVKGRKVGIFFRLTKFIQSIVLKTSGDWELENVKHVLNERMLVTSAVVSSQTDCLNVHTV